MNQFVLSIAAVGVAVGLVARAAHDRVAASSGGPGGCPPGAAIQPRKRGRDRISPPVRRGALVIVIASSKWGEGTPCDNQFGSCTDVRI